MRILTALLLFLSISLPALAAAPSIDYKIIAEPQYEAVLPMQDGYAAAKQNGKWGYIDENGNTVIAPGYDYACCFYEGRALVGTKSDAPDASAAMYDLGIIDTSGKYTPLMLMDSEGNTVPFRAEEFLLFRADPISYELFAEPIDFGFWGGYLTVPNSPSNEIYTASSLVFDKSGILMDCTVSADEYYAGPFSDGLFKSCHPRGYDETATVFYDENGKAVVSFPRYKPDGKNGNYVFSDVYEFYNGYAAAMIRKEEDAPYDTRFALADISGKIVFTGNYDAFFYKSDTGRDRVRVLNDGLICLKDAETGKCGAVDIHGNIKIPFIYDSVYPCTEGLCLVEKNGLWGYVSSSGDIIIKPQYDSATSFRNGIAIVRADDRTFITDRYNNRFGSPEMISIDSYFRKNFIIDHSNIIITEKNGLFGFTKLTYNPGSPLPEEMPSWAYAEVTEAIKQKLVPLSLQNNYSSNITRYEFAQLIVKSLEEISGKSIDILLKDKTGFNENNIFDSNPFRDTADKNIIAAHKLGIIKGISDDKFAPENEISRQDAAVLLMRAAQLFVEDTAISDPDFADSGDISGYAKEAVDYVTTLKIMNGTGSGRFDPAAPYTRQQAYITLLRLVNYLNEP